MNKLIIILSVLFFCACQSNETKLRNLLLYKKQIEKKILYLDIQHDSICISRKPNVNILCDYSKYDTEENIKHESERIQNLYDSARKVNFSYDTMKMNLDIMYLVIKRPLYRELDSIKLEIEVLKGSN